MKVLALILILLLTGCSLVRNPVDVKAQYLEQIKEWQQRQQKEGWTIDLVDNILEGTKWLTSYVFDEGDHWDTYKEISNKGLMGDCEDKAVAMIGSLKYLGYPHRAMVRIVTTMQPADHAIVVVEMPDGNIREYDSITSSFLDRMFYRKVVDFDEKEIK